MSRYIVEFTKKNYITASTYGLLILCFIIGISHLLYVVFSRQYPQWDEHHYLSLAIGYHDIFQTSPSSWYNKILAASEYRQPAYPMLLTVPLLLFGTDHTYKLALLFNGVLYVTTILCVYYLAKSFMDESTSLMAAIIFAFYGNSLFFLHFTYSETALTAFIAITLLLLWKSEDFTRPRESMLTALFLGLTNLVKWSAPAFMLLPFVFVGLRAIIRAIRFPTSRKTITLHLLLVFLFGIAIPFLSYYVPNWEPFIAYVKRNQTDGPAWVATYRYADMANTLSIHSLMYYFNIISQNTVYFWVLFGVGLLISLIFIRRYAYLVLCFASQYGFLTLFTVWKEDRYAVSMYPFMALISAVVFARLRPGILRWVIIILTVSLAFLNFLGASWGVGPMGKRGLADIVLPAFIKHPRRIYLTPLVWPPNKEYVNAHKLFEIIKFDVIRPTVVQLFVYEPWDNAVTSILQYEKRNALMINRISSDSDYESKNKLMSQADYVLTKNTQLTDNAFNLIGTIDVPIDQSRVYIYKRK